MSFYIFCFVPGGREREGGLGNLVYLQIANAENIQVLKILHMLACPISPAV